MQKQKGACSERGAGHRGMGLREGALACALLPRGLGQVPSTDGQAPGCAFPTELSRGHAGHVCESALYSCSPWDMETAVLVTIVSLLSAYALEAIDGGAGRACDLGDWA